jgi:hypothetical protein
MGKEYQGITRKTQPASGPKRARLKPHKRNALYTLAAEFKARNPLATAAGAWKHFTGLVGMSTVLIAYDAAADVLTYAPDIERYGTRQIKRRSFERGYYKLPALHSS